MISVIVPVYNVESYLKKCIESNLLQTYKNIEIILVDDGSLDLSGTICDQYSIFDSRIQVIHKTNGGLSSARNAGLDVASGDYIGFVDSDDYIAPEMYRLLYNALQHNKASVAICGYERVNEEGQGLSTVSYRDSIMSRSQVYEMLVQGNVYFTIVCSKLFRRDVIGNTRFKEGKLHEDEFIIHHLYGKADKIVTVSQPLYKYLCRSSSIMGTMKRNERAFDEVEAHLDRIVWFRKKSFIELAKKELLQIVRIYTEIKQKLNYANSAIDERANETRKLILLAISESDNRSLTFRERISIYTFKVGDTCYISWQKLLRFLSWLKHGR